MSVDGTQIDHLKAGLQLAGQHADRRTTADEVAQHLPGDRLRIGRDTFFDHTVVTRKNADGSLAQGWPFTPLQARQLNGQAFKLAE